ncbi:uncharacterized [Tachysurus ichikawai]
MYCDPDVLAGGHGNPIVSVYVRLNEPESLCPCHGSSGGTVISMIKRRSCLSVHCLPGFLSLPLSWSPDVESNRCVQWPSEACLASILQYLTA